MLKKIAPLVPFRGLSRSPRLGWMTARTRALTSNEGLSLHGAPGLRDDF